MSDKRGRGDTVCISGYRKDHTCKSKHTQCIKKIKTNKQIKQAKKQQQNNQKMFLK